MFKLVVIGFMVFAMAIAAWGAIEIQPMPHSNPIDIQYLWAQYQEESWFQLGVAYFKNHQLLEALNAFRFAISVNPLFVEAYQNAACVYLQLGDIKEAAMALYVVVELDPRNAQAHHLLGVIFLMCALYEDAVFELEQAAILSPENALIYYNLGFARESNGSFALAKESYEKALHLNPELLEASERLKGVEKKINEGQGR